MGFDGAAFDEFGDEFDALGFAAGEGGRGLAELEVAEAGVGHELERGGDAGLGVEEGGGFIDGHGEDVADVFVAEGDFERGGVVALAIAGFAMDPGGGQEIHFEFHAAVAFAIRAAAAFGVEGEAGGVEAAHAGLGELGEEGADVIEDLHIGGRTGAGGLADGRLIDFVTGFDGFSKPVELAVWRLLDLACAVENRRHALVHEGGFAGAGDAGEHGEPAERDGGGEVLAGCWRGSR